MIYTSIYEAELTAHVTKALKPDSLVTWPDTRDVV